MRLFLVSLERKQSLATAGPQSCLKWGVSAFFRRCTAVPQLHWIPFILLYLPGPRGIFNLQSCSRFLATGASPFLWHQIFCLYCCWVYASCGLWPGEEKCMILPFTQLGIFGQVLHHPPPSFRFVVWVMGIVSTPWSGCGPQCNVLLPSSVFLLQFHSPPTLPFVLL